MKKTTHGGRDTITLEELLQRHLPAPVKLLLFTSAAHRENSAIARRNGGLTTRISLGSTISMQARTGEPLRRRTGALHGHRRAIMAALHGVTAGRAGGFARRRC
jgi:hypothetical protein